MRNVILALSLLAACSDSTSVAPPSPVKLAPIDVEKEAKFKVGDVVMVEGMPFEFKVLDVGPVVEWTKSSTGEKLMSRAYLIQFSITMEVNGKEVEDVQTLQMPEVALSKKQ